ncbi:MAG: cobalamin B12-binding domain-containing protein [Candidatus Thermoplasmatota archaeon]|nr:cobalamin B12-binding domain-containing protein [Candidatus Thermoplasmatota archaeon]
MSLRVMIAKPGLDGHDRGAKVLARALRDAGMEVIYTGIRRTPSEIAEAAVEEDVDVLGLNCLSGAHMSLFPKVIEELKARGAGDIIIIASGIIPEEDGEKLKASGISNVFGPGASIKEIVDFIKSLDENKNG